MRSFFTIIILLASINIYSQEEICYTLVQGGPIPNTENKNYGSGSIFNEAGDNVYNFEFSPFESFDGNELCLSPGCYTLEGEDFQGNGWGGVTFSMALDGDTVIGSFTLEIAQFNFASKTIGYFTVGDVQCDIPGCQDSLATNYNAFANIDVCSCRYPPVNDRPENALEISCGEEVWGNTINATRLGIPESSCFNESSSFSSNDDYPLGRGVWYKLIGTGDTYTVNSCGSNYDASVIVYNSDFTCADQEMGSCLNAAVRNTSTFSTTEGEDYFLYMTGPGGEILYGDYLLRVYCDEEYIDAENTSCESAIQLECGETQFVHPVNTSFNGPEGCPNNNNGVWYFVEGTNEVVNIEVASEEPVEISAFSGSCDSENILVCQASTSNMDRRSITIETMIGESYYVYISGLNTGTNPIETPLLNITLTCGLTIPSNDTPCEAININSGDNIYGETYLATDDAEFIDEECTTSFYDPVGLWYKYEADESGTLRLNSFYNGERRSPYFNLLYTFSGVCSDLSCENPPNFSYLRSFDQELEVEGGTTYYFLVATVAVNNPVGYFEFEVTFTPEVDCPERGLNIGDPCENCSSEDVPKFVQDDCSCAPVDVEPGECEEHFFYLTSTTEEGCDIFRVELDEDFQTADLTYLNSLPYEVHIAFNESDELLYAVRSEGGSFRTVDVSVENGELGEEIELTSSLDFTHVTIADFAPDGSLVIGDMDNLQIVKVNIENGLVSQYASGNVSGGDIAYGLDGAPYLASRIFSGSIYKINPETGINEPVGDVSNLVTGMTTMPNGNFLVSYKNSLDLIVKNDDGSDNPTTYSMFLDGDPFMSSDGDLTDGCFTTVQNPIQWNESGIIELTEEYPDSEILIGEGFLDAYPNPTKSKIRISFGTTETTFTKVFIVDTRGSLVSMLHESTAEGRKTYAFEFNTENLPNGVYICKMINRNEVITEKIIVSR